MSVAPLARTLMAKTFLRRSRSTPARLWPKIGAYFRYLGGDPAPFGGSRLRCDDCRSGEMWNWPI